jgi:peptidoglycan/LPS O-acetylase OafA/YrhL
MGWAARARNRVELAPPGSDARLRPMEGLRGLAVMLVFLVHFATAVLPGLTDAAVALVLVATRAAGHAGVDLFFVLSGYLIYRSVLGRPLRWRGYALRRVERIYPAFLATFVLYLLLLPFFGPEGRMPVEPWALGWYLVHNLLLLGGLLPLPVMITVTWSLSYEVFYYLAVPALVGVAGLRSWTSAARCLLFIGMALAGSAWCFLHGGPIRMVMFIAGMLVHEWVDRQQRRVGMLPALAGLLLCIAVAAVMDIDETTGVWGMRPGLWQPVAHAWMLLAGFGAVCAHCLGREKTWLTRAFSATPVRWLGNMSYSYYLTHALGIKAMMLVLAAVGLGAPGGAAGALALLPLAFVASFAVPLPLFLFIERPYSLAPASASAGLTRPRTGTRRAEGVRRP